MTLVTGNSEKGVTLVITFLIATVMLAVVLSISVILFSQMKIVANIGNSVTSFYVAESGAEKTLFFDRKQIPNGGNRGVCNICNVCSSSSCADCTIAPLAEDGCNTLQCTNCSISYTTTFDGKSYEVNTKVYPKSQNSAVKILNVQVKGFYLDTARSIEVNITN